MVKKRGKCNWQRPCYSGTASERCNNWRHPLQFYRDLLAVNFNCSSFVGDVAKTYAVLVEQLTGSGWELELVSAVAAQYYLISGCNSVRCDKQFDLMSFSRRVGGEMTNSYTTRAWGVVEPAFFGYKYLIPMVCYLHSRLGHALDWWKLLMISLIHWRFHSEKLFLIKMNIEGIALRQIGEGMLGKSLRELSFYVIFYISPRIA